MPIYIVEGRVIQSTGSWYKVSTGDAVFDCRLPGKFRLKEHDTTNPIAVGDRVEFSLNEDNTGSIKEIKDRTNWLPREATHGRQGMQILVSNIDRAFVIQSIRKPRLKAGFIDRFLVTCEAYQIPPCIVINKMDLVESDGQQQQVNDLRNLYEDLGYPVVTTSIYNENSIEQLKQELTDITSVFVGPSGVGKTSLLNAIDPDLEHPVEEISDYSQKGKHTTTYAQLLPLDFGGYLVDTPGIREFGLVDIEPYELSLFFPEMREHARQCKFNNCTHSHEPKCAVMEAYEKGQISAGRYESYLNMLDSISD